MIRHGMEALLKWKEAPDRMPLLLQGARQVGKTWLVREFGRLHFESLAYFSLDEEPDLVRLFDSTKDPDRLLDILAIRLGKPIVEGQTLLVLDEIQESNAALNALKYFCEKKSGLHVVASGSYLGVAMTGPSGFPVGKVQFMRLLPMTFNEFLQADNSESLARYVAADDFLQPIPEIIFQPLLEKWHAYMTTGGMPAAVRAWTEFRDMERVDVRQQEILMSYEQDFSKHVDRREIAKVWGVWKSIPGQLARENRKFVYSLIREGARAKEYEDAIRWISQTGTIHLLPRVEKPGIPLQAYEDPHAFKIYFSDVGLLRQKTDLAANAWTGPQAWFTEFKGALAENAVLQELVGQFRFIGYWTSSATAEVDFVVQQGSRILPVEVKSGENVRAKSMRECMTRHDLPLGIRFSARNVARNGDVWNFPIFLAGQLKRLVE